MAENKMYEGRKHSPENKSNRGEWKKRIAAVYLVLQGRH
jgi:hypothetical protein